MDHLVRFEPSGTTLRVAPGTSLWEATRRAGLPIASACGANRACARCGVEIIEGADNVEPEGEGERRIKERNRIDAKLRLACHVTVRGELTITAPYW